MKADTLPAPPNPLPSPQCLTPMERLARSPAFSRDGTKLAYLGSTDGFDTYAHAYVWVYFVSALTRVVVLNGRIVTLIYPFTLQPQWPHGVARAGLGRLRQRYAPQQHFRMPRGRPPYTTRSNTNTYNRHPTRQPAPRDAGGRGGDTPCRQTRPEGVGEQSDGLSGPVDGLPCTGLLGPR